MTNNELNLEVFMSYVDERLEKDAETNKSLDLGELEYHSLFNRSMMRAVTSPSKESLLSLVCVATIMVLTEIASEDLREFIAAVMMLNTYYQGHEPEVTCEVINQELMRRYNYLVYNCTLTKLDIVTHTYDTLVGKTMQ